MCDLPSFLSLQWDSQPMAQQKIYTDALVELYSMSRMYADNNNLTSRQKYAIEVTETIIENNTGYEITEPFGDEWVSL